MPVTLDPDSAAVYKAFQEAGRPAYETMTPSEAREFYLQGRAVTNPEAPELKSVAPLSTYFSKSRWLQSRHYGISRIS